MICLSPEIPSDLIAKIKIEMEEEYNSGWKSAIVFAGQKGYSIVNKVVKQEKDVSPDVKDHLKSVDYFDATDKWVSGFRDALKEVLKQSQ